MFINNKLYITYHTLQTIIVQPIHNHRTLIKKKSFCNTKLLNHKIRPTAKLTGLSYFKSKLSHIDILLHNQ